MIIELYKWTVALVETPLELELSFCRNCHVMHVTSRVVGSVSTVTSDLPHTGHRDCCTHLSSLIIAPMPLSMQRDVIRWVLACNIGARAIEIGTNGENSTSQCVDIPAEGLSARSKLRALSHYWEQICHKTDNFDAAASGGLQYSGRIVRSTWALGWYGLLLRRSLWVAQLYISQYYPLTRP